jgi:hypothetical protein
MLSLKVVYYDACLLFKTAVKIKVTCLKEPYTKWKTYIWVVKFNVNSYLAALNFYLEDRDMNTIYLAHCTV